MRIERVEASRHKKGRVLVFLEDGACLKITEQELLDFGLRSGDELDEETLTRRKEAAGVSNTRAAAAELRGAGKRLLVATSKPENMAVRVLEHFGLAQYFDRICGAPPDNQEGARKVCVVRAALRWAGIEDLSSAVMVGDRRHDIEGAREAGLQAVGVLYGYGSREELEKAGAAYIAADMDELRGVLL